MSVTPHTHREITLVIPTRSKTPTTLKRPAAGLESFKKNWSFGTSADLERTQFFPFATPFFRLNVSAYPAVLKSVQGVRRNSEVVETLTPITRQHCRHSYLLLLRPVSTQNLMNEIH